MAAQHGYFRVKCSRGRWISLREVGHRAPKQQLTEKKPCTSSTQSIRSRTEAVRRGITRANEILQDNFHCQEITRPPSLRPLQSPTGAQDIHRQVDGERPPRLDRCHSSSSGSSFFSSFIHHHHDDLLNIYTHTLALTPHTCNIIACVI